MIKNTLIYVFGGLISQIIVFVLWILLPRFLTTVEIGIYTNCLYYIELFSAICIVGGDSVITRYYHSETVKENIFRQVVFVTFAASIILGCLLFINISVKFFDFNLIDSGLFYFLPILIITNSLANISLIHFSALKEAFKYSKIQIFKSVSFFTFAILFSIGNLKLQGLFLALFFSSLITIIFFIKYSDYKFSTKFSFNYEPFLYGLPLMIYGIVGIISIYASRIFLEKKLGFHFLGIFSFFLVIAYQINGFLTSFNKSWTPEVFSKFKTSSSLNFLENAAYVLAFIYLSLLFFGSIFGHIFLFDFLFNVQYLNYTNVLLVLLTFPLFAGIYTIFYPMFYLENKTWNILFLATGISSINILILFYLINYLGINGAAIGTVANSIFGLIVYLVYFRNIIKLSRRFITWLCVMIISVLLVSFSILFYNNYYVFYIVILFLVSYTFYIGDLYRFGPSIISPFISRLKQRNQF